MKLSGSQHANSKKIVDFFYTKPYIYWEREKELSALTLFHKTAKHVPAYKHFLNKNRVKPEKIKTFGDLRHVPLTNKKNYLQQYPLKDLVWQGNLKTQLTFTSTSGSTGSPYYFPRTPELDWQSSLIHDFFLRNSSHGLAGPTLVIVGFSMGVWIGGLITYKAFEIANQENKRNLSILTPGINKNEILKIIKNLSPLYNQTIIAGYPPFVKDVIDESNRENINLKKLNIRILTAAESFDENFRDYLVGEAGIKNSCLDTMNIYGSADMGTMAFETPLSILVRRLARKDKILFKDLFSSILKTPTLTQYNPKNICFESEQGQLILTGNNAIPLIRYAIGDHGGTFSYNDLLNVFAKRDINLRSEIEKNKIKKYSTQLPFVYVYERVDLSTTLYGLQIYPEMIKEVLFKPLFRKDLTGKFTLITKFDKKQNQYLEINLELQKKKILGKKKNIILLKKIVENLQRKNSEFRELSSYLQKRAVPKIVPWAYNDPLYFKNGVKQKWIINQ